MPASFFKILHGLAPQPLGECIQQKNSSGRATRAATSVVLFDVVSLAKQSSQYGSKLLELSPY